MKEHHYEVIVTEEADEMCVGIRLNDEHSATWWSGTIWDDDAEEWIAHSENNARAEQYLRAWLDAPWRIRRIFEEWTQDDGWDINIMSDIMGLLISLGVVDKDELVAR